MSGAPGSRVGSTFGPYELKRALGRGGMGEVYEAEHTVKGWTVALKLMSESVSSDPVFRERMRREARITGRLQEPHVVPIHDYGEIDGQMFLEMRLIEGTDLDTLLKRFGALSPPRAVAILTQIASALDAAHAAGVTHRDVKPPNILVTRDDFAYLVDFGIASAKTDEKLTQLGTAVGTWKYMAPERFSDGQVDYRADIYSLACVLYECLTGSPPYASDSAGVLVSAHLMEPIPQPSAKRSGIPKAFDAVIARGMAKKPEDRYASAGDLVRAAHDALTNPDQTQAVDILRRSTESTLPKLQGLRGAAPPAQQPPRPAPAWNPTPAPDSGPLPRAGQPAPNPVAYQPQWAGPPPQFAGPAPYGPGHPPPPPRQRNPWAIVAGVAAVVLVLVVVVVGISMAVGNDGDETPNAATTTTTTPSTTRTTTSTAPSSSTPPPGALNRLLGLLPPGYPAGTCKPDRQPMPGAIVSVMCGQNTDTDGPTVSAFGLFDDLRGVQDAFNGFMKSDTLVKCPGDKASPGTWWHNKDPNTILGQIACGTYKGDEPQVMWSNQQTMVFAVVSGNPQGPNMDQLYKWWSSHS
ncbi:protein kinase [Mycobacterium alsense]|uniref:non-specific serine/threonine protein kinase n=1 Tax=Mycobacterium alsense TaxID=324058 RepID=A0ABD6NUH3_9MYCO|nr:serine/threonine-protein kinase [Mycobacterium alsense]OBG29135.1 protein kinase [Mycobacterium alsense]